jgi:phage/plasmid-like protein (TIGR03299 family)
MAHALDTTDGVTSYVDSRSDAWHQLGQQLDHAFTAEEAMEQGHLGGWNVRKWPAFATDPDTGFQIPKAGRVDIVRDNPIRKGQIDVFGEVGENYQIIQNEGHADFLNALVDESGAHFETGGALYGGRQVFLTMKLPGHINIGGVDPIENYIAAINSHDGSMSFTLITTPIRVVCANTLNVAFQNKSNIFRIRHTSGAEKALRQHAREALDMTFNYLDGFQEEAEKLIQTAMTQAKFEAIIEEAFGAADDASSATTTRADKRIAEMTELFAEAHTQEGVRETAWAGFNALTEWADHMAPTRGDDRDDQRARNALLDPSFKQKALKLMMANV